MMQRHLHIVALLTLALAAYLRLYRVDQTPGWFSDEGTHLAIARSLQAGQVQYLALNQSTLLAARLPLFELLLSAAVSVGGLSMGTLRTLTGLLGVLSVALLYGVVQAAFNRRAALLAALMLAIYPQAVLYSRFGFSYNLLAPLVLGTLLGLVKYHQSKSGRWLALAGGCVGLGLTSDVMMSAFIVPVLVVIWFTRWRDGVWAGALMAGPFAVYAALMLATVPDAFLFDLQYTLTRLGGRTLPEQIETLAMNYTILLSQDFWFLTGLIGLFLLPMRSLRNIAVLMLLVPIAMVGRKVALHSLSAYYTIPLLPLVALGVGYFVEKAFQVVSQWEGLRPSPTRVLLALLLIGTPLATTVYLTVRNVQSYYPTAIDPFLLDPDAAQQAADYVNTHSEVADSIIASPAIAWMFEANSADFQMAIAATGVGTPHLPNNIPADRWAFDPRYEQVRYVVIDNLWRNWGAVHIPAVAAMMEAVTDGWALVFEAGGIQVYERPD